MSWMEILNVASWIWINTYTSCDTMGGIPFCGCGSQSENPFVFLVENPRKGPSHEISHKTGRGRGKKGPRKAVNRREQQRTVGRREQSREGQSRDESRAERRQVNRTQKGAC